MPAAPTFTFDPGLGTQMDSVRFRIGDSNGAPQWFLADQTINAMLTRFAFDEACAQCAEAIGALCAQLATTVQQRNLKLQYQARSEEMFALASRIRNLAQPAPGEPLNPGATGSVGDRPETDAYVAATSLLGKSHF